MGMTTQAPRPLTMDTAWRITRHYRDQARANLERTRRNSDSLCRDIDASETVSDAMRAGAYRKAADLIELPAETYPGYVMACAQLADIRTWAEEAGKLAGLALETAAA